MKRVVSFVIVLVLIFLSLVGCAHSESDENISGKFKRIQLSGDELGDGETTLDKTISTFTKIEFNASETFSETMPIYEIKPREISEDELIAFAGTLGINGEIQKNKSGSAIRTTDGASVSVEENYISYSINKTAREKMTQSDEELIKQAKEIVAKITLLEGEYECLGVASVTSASTEDGDYAVRKRISFKKQLDDVRLLGDEMCNVYFNSDGLCGINIRLFSYEANGEMEMLSLEDAKSKIKAPDAFSLSATETTSVLTGKADTLRVDRVKLLYVNQYSNGCMILQPVYSFIGAAIAGERYVEFQSRVIAIPEKYTYTE